MILSYVTTALRNLVRYKAYSSINIFGLAIGIACCLLILIYVQGELSYDGFHDKSDRIYRVCKSVSRPDGFGGMWAAAGVPPAPLIAEDYPGVECAVRFFRPRVAIKQNNNACFEDRFFFADPDVFKVFSFRLSEGDPETVLREPFTVVLTADKARKYFGDLDPIGRTLTLQSGQDLVVTGIIEEVPQNSHIKFDFLASFESYLIEVPSFRSHWDGPVWTYLLLKEGCIPSEIEAAFPDFIAIPWDKAHSVWKPGYSSSQLLLP